MADIYDMGERPRVQFVISKTPETLITCIDVFYPNTAVLHRTDTASGKSETLKMFAPVEPLLNRLSDAMGVKVDKVLLSGRGASVAFGSRWNWRIWPERVKRQLDAEQHLELWEAVTAWLEKEVKLRRRFQHDLEQQLDGFRGATNV
jgi:hypothetical protein